MIEVIVILIISTPGTSYAENGIQILTFEYGLLVPGASCAPQGGLKTRMVDLKTVTYMWILVQPKIITDITITSLDVEY